MDRERCFRLRHMRRRPNVRGIQGDGRETYGAGDPANPQIRHALSRPHGRSNAAGRIADPPNRA
jgi:hypothetical protein